jgi:hypothetical protein
LNINLPYICGDFLKINDTMATLKDNGQRAKNAILLIWILLALEIVSLISSYFQYDLLQTVANGGDVSMEQLEANDTREQMIGIIYIIAYIISGVTFIRWFRRAYYNLHQKVTQLSFSDGWAAGCWFVPVVCLFRPYQIMKELYQKTQKVLTKREVTITEKFSTNFLGWWWALWIISNYVGQFLIRYTLKVDTLDGLITSTVVSMAAGIIDIPLALITVKVIKDYAAVEPVLSELRDDVEIAEK